MAGREFSEYLALELAKFRRIGLRVRDHRRYLDRGRLFPRFSSVRTTLRWRPT